MQVRTEEELAEAFSYARNEGADKLCFIECMIHRRVRIPENDRMVLR